MSRIQSIVLSSVAFGVAGLLTACSTGGPDTDPAAQNTAAAAEEGATGSEADDGFGDGDLPREGSPASAGLDPANLPEPIATSEVPATVEGDPDATMTVDFYGLQRDDATVTARFAFTVNSDSEGPKWLYHYLGDQGWHPYLIDTQNLKKHAVISNGQERAQTAYQGARFSPGQTLYAFAVFAAPEDVDTVSLVALEGAWTIPDVQVP